MGWLAALISAGAEVGQAYLNKEITSQLNKENAELQHHYWNLQNDKTFAQNETAADNADARTRALYNDLQSPEAMKKQLLDAGLNPALMYSQGGIGGSVQQGAQGAGGGSAKGVSTLGLQNFISATNIAQIMKTNAETKNLEADTKNKEEENKNIIQDTALKKSQELLNIQTKDQNEQKFEHELAILIATQAIQENEQTMLNTKNEITNKQLKILESETKLREYEEELAKRFKEKGWDLGSLTGLGSLFIQMGDKLINLLNKWEINLPEWMIP